MTGFAASAESIFKLALEEVADFAILLIDSDGKIEAWNRGAESIFGHRADDVLGRDFSLLFTEDDRASGVPQRELELARKNGRAEDSRWHVRADGTVFFADGVTSALRDDSGALVAFVKIGRDITDRFRAEQRIATQLSLTNLLNEEQPVATTARRVMQIVCENLGWDIGGLWDVDEAAAVIRYIDHWSCPDVDASLSAELFRDRDAFHRGEGLPGEVWQTGKAIWISELSDAARFPRAQIARRAGLKAAFAFPIVHDGRVTGAMEFFSIQEREPDQPLIPIMTLIGSQIGDYIARHRTAQALRASEEHNRLISETAQDAIFTIDEESVIRTCNPAVERLFGYRAEELIGRKLDVIIPERYREAHRQGIQRFLRTRERHIPWTGVELPALHRDGHEFPVEISFGEFTSGNRTVFTGFARDVTQRQRTEHELKSALDATEAARAQLERRAEEEASFRHLASALTGAVEMTEVLYEITNRATLVTRADGVYVERIVGGSKNVEIVASAGRGTPPRGLRVAFPGSVTEEMINAREPVILAEMRGVGKSMAPYLADSCMNCQLLVTPLIAEDEPLGALVLLNSRQSGREFKDSDIVRARTLGDLTSLALRRVRLMEQEREAKEKAEAAVRVRDETLGIVSHDLRNPLTHIALSADLLSTASADEQGELIETIRTAARQMQRLIQDLLDVARLEAGRFSVDKSIIDAESVVRDVCESHRALAEQRKQNIVCEVKGPLPEICADRDRLLQVFGNLIGNAMKFTPPRGTITVEAFATGAEVTFRVSDTGPGIPDADIKNVFRPYWQAKKTAHMGAGLGLAIVRGIVEAHRGKMWAENRAGGGAMFTFTIPV